ncbi:hypothetical protein HK096_004799, partial [Nowakowskiella sp. JEL0078]
MTLSTTPKIEVPIETLQIVSQILGWGYFIAWSVSFYPQVFLNIRRKSVTGLSFDFLWLNLWGFIAYSVFNTSLYYSETIRNEYLKSFGILPQVQQNDVVFGLHATAITVVTIFQTFVYERHPEQKISPFVWNFFLITGFGFGVLLLDYQFGHAWLLDAVFYSSFVKMSVTLIKYFPQAVFNFRRKSTVGWSINNILLDLTGGILSFLQLALDAWIVNDWNAIYGNPVKLGLGLVSIFFDVLFMIQHYILYRADFHEDEITPLLSQ